VAGEGLRDRAGAGGGRLGRCRLHGTGCERWRSYAAGGPFTSAPARSQVIQPKGLHLDERGSRSSSRA
jgi:hypothetical protein